MGLFREILHFKGNIFSPSSEHFQILALKRGEKKVCLFFEILAFSEKTTLSPSLGNFKQSDREVRIPLVEDAVILKAATGYKLLEGLGAQSLFVFIFNKLNEKWKRILSTYTNAYIGVYLYMHTFLFFSITNI